MLCRKKKKSLYLVRERSVISRAVFANQMADAFENLGFDVQVCEFDEQDDLDAVFQPLYGKNTVCC